MSNFHFCSPSFYYCSHLFNSVWRPLVEYVEDWPIALCDGSTIDPADLVEIDNVRRHYTGASMYALYNDNQKWYYMSKQRRSDVLLFKTFDSRKDVPSISKMLFPQRVIIPLMMVP